MLVKDNDCQKFIKKNKIFDINKILICRLDYYIKAFIFLAYNIILDLCFSNFCFGSNDIMKKKKKGWKERQKIWEMIKEA